jgi:hypothetical protein
MDLFAFAKPFLNANVCGWETCVPFLAHSNLFMAKDCSNENIVSLFSND